ncbi:MAG: magnesium transporter [Thermoproteota archaeon]|nr:magnesium transporter [Thermoproteota archaeon]
MIRLILYPKIKTLVFCISLSERGTQSQHSNSYEDFLPLLEQSSITWADIKVDNIPKEIIEIADKFGFSHGLGKQLFAGSTDGRHFQGGYEDLDTEMGLLFPVIRTEDFNITIKPLMIFLKRGLVLTVRNRDIHIFHNLHRYAKTFFKKLPKNLQPIDWLSLILIRIIDENNKRNFEQLQEIDESSGDLTRNFKSDTPFRTDFGEKIIEMKHALITYLSGLWKL